MFIGLAWILLNKRLLARNTPIAVTAYGVAAGTAMLLLCVPPIYGLPHLAHLALRVWLALAASSLLCTASTTLLWNWGLTQVPAAQAGVLCNLEPLVGSLLGVFLLGESLGPSARTGGAMILVAAIAITTLSRTNRREQLPLT
jgi:drug/metabolite transporter (DMT)-like permease